VEHAAGSLRVRVEHEEHDAPIVVRAIVGAGGGVVEVRPEVGTLEQVYFEVMGVRPGVGDRDPGREVA
jgi:hypothetical protein